MASCSDRRCAACGADLHGKTASPVSTVEGATLLSCRNSSCLSRVYNDADLTLEERKRVMSHIHNLRCQTVRAQVCDRAGVSCYT